MRAIMRDIEEHITLPKTANLLRLLNLPLIICFLLTWVVNTPYRTSAAQDAPVLMLGSAPFGINTHLSTRYTNIDTMSIPADLISQAGAGWAREDIHWYRIQPNPNTWDWSFTDAALRVLVQRNIKIVGVLGHPPGWATPYGGDGFSEISFFAPNPERFAAFAQAVAQRYSNYVHHWEIWNEPDNTLFWKPAPDPVTYAHILTLTANAIRSANPHARILIGGFNPFDTHFLRAVADAGAWNSFDIIAIHPYIDPVSPEAGNMLAVTEGVRAIAAQFGERPIWVTEIGWSSRPDARDPPGSTADEQTQANYLVRATLMLWRAGVEQIFWYTLKDDPEGDPYGMFTLGSGRADFSQPKAAYYAFQNLSRQLSGAEFVGMRDLFERRTVLDFEQFGVWYRGDQANGRFSPTDAIQHSGRGAGQLAYRFPTTANDYVVFRRSVAALIPGQPYAIGMWVYGDASGHTLKLWLRDSEGEILQYTLGAVGPANWRLMQAPIGGTVADWDRITTGGNGRIDFPARVEAIVLDDAPDRVAGSGTIYIDDIVAISGPEAYDMQLLRGGTAVDVLWAPTPVLASISTRSASARVFNRDGVVNTVEARNARVVVQLGPGPIYVRHTR